MYGLILQQQIWKWIIEPDDKITRIYKDESEYNFFERFLEDLG